VKPTARYPAAAEAGIASDDRPTLIVGFRSLTEYDARAFAGRLEAAGVPFDVAGAEVEFAEAFRADTKITRLAKALDHDEAIDGVPAREALAKAVGPHLHDVVDEAGGDRVERVGFPAFLGDQEGDAVRAELADRLGADVFEIPMGPPSLRGSGWRTDCTTRSTTRASGSRPGIRSSASRPRRTARSRRLRSTGRAAERRPTAPTPSYSRPAGSSERARLEPRGRPRACVRLHVEQPADRYEWFVDDAFGDQPYARFGVRIDEDGRVLDADGSAYENVFAAGGVVGGADVAKGEVRERGVARDRDCGGAGGGNGGNPMTRHTDDEDGGAEEGNGTNGTNGAGDRDNPKPQPRRPGGGPRRAAVDLRPRRRGAEGDRRHRRRRRERDRRERLDRTQSGRVRPGRRVPGRRPRPPGGRRLLLQVHEL